jgi:uncharacterized protein (TIGR03086 family)
MLATVQSLEQEAMNDATEKLELLARAIEQDASLIAAIGADQAEQPTPCGDWEVRRLVNHTVGDLHQFRPLLRGGRYERSDEDVIGDDWAGAYREAADALLADWSAPGALDGTIKIPTGELPATWRVGQLTVEMVIHGWDLARATDQSTDLDPAPAQLALAWGSENLKPEYRGPDSAFGVEVPVAGDAPIYDRVAGFFGRDPNWSRSG